MSKKTPHKPADWATAAIENGTGKHYPRAEEIHIYMQKCVHGILDFAIPEGSVIKVSMCLDLQEAMGDGLSILEWLVSNIDDWISHGRFEALPLYQFPMWYKGVGTGDIDPRIADPADFSFVKYASWLLGLPMEMIEEAYNKGQRG